MDLRNREIGRAKLGAGIYVAAVATTLCENMGVTPLQLSVGTIRGLFALETGLAAAWAFRAGWYLTRKSAAVKAQRRVERGDIGA
jgi:hypothetical protein